MNWNTAFLLRVFAAPLVLLAGCIRQSDNVVVVYCALDREFSAPVLEEFTKQTGIQVRTKFDVESTKTVGLTQAILAESARSRCDVFWNNEILNTLRLEHQKLLQPYTPPSAEKYPAAYRSSTGHWHGFAARARIILVNTQLVDEEDWPSSIMDLADPKWKGKVGLAKPLFGTTATHAVSLFHSWGNDQALEFFKQVRSNAQILSGNKQVALAVSRGQIAWGVTDTDDALLEIDRGMPVRLIVPDQAEGQAGCLLIPNTVAIIRSAPHPENARRLIDFLVTTQVEQRLAAGPSGQIPLAIDAAWPDRVPISPETWQLSVNFEEAARKWDAVAKELRDLFMAM